MKSFAEDLRAVRFERLAELLSDPAVLRGEYLPEEERRRYEECQQSIVDAAVWWR